MSSSKTPEEATTALILFITGNYDACLQTLQRLDLNDIVLEADGIKVQHNLAIVEHLCNQINDEQLYSQLRALVTDNSSKEQVSTSASAVNTRSSGHTQSRSADAIKINQAILLYRMQCYDSAIELLEPMLERLSNIDEGSALHACLLLLDVHLQQRNARKASLVLGAFESAYADIAYGFRCMLGSTSEQVVEHYHQPGRSNQARPVSQTPLVTRCDSSTMEQACRLLVSQGLLAVPGCPDLPGLLTLYRARLAILQNNIDVATVVLASPSAACRFPVLSASPHASKTLRSTREEGSSSGSLRIASAHLELTRGLTQSSERMLRSMINLPLINGVLRVCNQLCSLGEWQSALVGCHGSATSEATDREDNIGGEERQAHQIPILNNLGIIFHRQGKHQLALQHFSQASGIIKLMGGESKDAIAEGTSAEGSIAEDSIAKQWGCLNVSQFHSYCLAYNSGMQHLKLGRYNAALASFDRCRDQISNGYKHYGMTLSALDPSALDPSALDPSSLITPSEPMVLFRSAEAVIGLYSQQSIISGSPPTGSQKDLKDLLYFAKKTLLDTLSAIVAARLERYHDPSSTSTSREVEGSSADHHERHHRVDTENNGLGLPSNDSSDEEDLLALWELKQSTLCKLSYVCLHLGEASAALSHALQALELSRDLSSVLWPCLPTNEMLAASYASEALSLLGREEEAARLMGEAHDRHQSRSKREADSSLVAHDPHSGLIEAQFCVSGDGGPSIPTLGIGSKAGSSSDDSPDFAVRQAFCTNYLAVMKASGQFSGADRSEPGTRDILKELAGEAAGGPGIITGRPLMKNSGGKSAAMLAAYINMMEGQSEKALELLRLFHN